LILYAQFEDGGKRQSAPQCAARAASALSDTRRAAVMMSGKRPHVQLSAALRRQRLRPCCASAAAPARGRQRTRRCAAAAQDVAQQRRACALWCSPVRGGAHGTARRPPESCRAVRCARVMLKNARRDYARPTASVRRTRYRETAARYAARENATNVEQRDKWPLEGPPFTKARRIAPETRSAKAASSSRTNAEEPERTKQRRPQKVLREISRARASPTPCTVWNAGSSKPPEMARQRQCRRSSEVHEQREGENKICDRSDHDPRSAAAS